jgi:hypothetical protein
MAQDGLYASLWNRQRQAEKAREVLAEALAEDSKRITAGRLQPTTPPLAPAPTPPKPDDLPG